MAMEPQYTLRETHNRNITALGYSPVRRELMVGFEDGFIRTWEADTGKPVAQYWEHSGWVTDFTYWTATKYMLSSANDGIILVWSIGGGVADYIVIGVPVYCMALNTRRQQLICGVNGGLQIFALDSEKSCGHVINSKLVYWAREHTDIVRCIVCHESRAYSAGYDQKLIIYDTSLTSDRMSPVVTTPSAHEAGIICLLLVKDNENNMWVVTSSFDKTVRIWSMDGKLVHKLDGFSSAVTGICYMPRNKVVWAAGGTSYATLYDSRSGDNISDFIPMFDDQDQNEEKYSLQILKCFPEFNQVVASTSRRHIMTWKYNPQGCVTTLKGNSPLESLAYTRKVPLLIFSGNTEGTITKWERMQSNHFMYREFFLLTDTKHGKKSYKKKVKVKPNRNITKSSAEMFHAKNNKRGSMVKGPVSSCTPAPSLVSNDIKQHEHPNLTTLRMLFVEDLDLLIAACEDGNIYVWGFDTAAVTVLQNMEPPDSDKHLISKYAVLLSNSSELLRETTINDNDSVSNRVAGFICKNILEEHDSCVTSLAVIGSDKGYNSTYLLSAGWDRRVALWDLATGDLVDTLKNAQLSPRDAQVEMACDGIITDITYSPSREIDNIKHWTDGGLEVAGEIDNIKHWTDGRRKMAGEIDNMKHWTDGGLLVAGEIDNIKHWIDGGHLVAGEIDNMKHWTDGGLEVAGQIDNIKDWTDDGLLVAGEIDNMKHWTDGGLEVAGEIDNIKHWTDDGLLVAGEIDNMKHWTDGGLEVAGEIDNMKHWTDDGLLVAGEIDNMKHWTDGGFEVAGEIDNIKHWTDDGLLVAGEIDNMKHWTDGGLEVAGEIDNIKHWTDDGLLVAGEIDNIKHWTDDGLLVAGEIDNMKHWTDGGLEVAGEIDNMKHWTDGGFEVAGEIDNIKHWTDDGLLVAGEIDNIKHWRDGGLEVAGEIARRRHHCSLQC
ncbi:hypothetical protein LSAT2_031314 [Lamellibrachia satsuma]|nr:hypothetical protein LSAT2_031314 [Lamellibrachia satsuma]